MCRAHHNIYDDFSDVADELDTSNFETDHLLYACTNRRVLGETKTETESTAPKKFVRLRAKMYSMWIHGAESKSFKTAKGIQKRCVKKHIRRQQFLDVLKNATKKTRTKFHMFRSTNHVLQTVEMTKLCLCAFDNKRYILDDGVHTLIYGHYSRRK